MSPRLNPQAILKSIVLNDQLIESIWIDVCSQIFTKHIGLLADSFDQFILRCCSDFDPLIAALPASVHQRACAIAASWGYESIQLRAVRFPLSPGPTGFPDGRSLPSAVPSIDFLGQQA